MERMLPPHPVCSQATGLGPPGWKGTVMESRASQTTQLAFPLSFNLVTDPHMVLLYMISAQHGLRDST